MQIMSVQNYSNMKKSNHIVKMGFSNGNVSDCGEGIPNGALLTFDEFYEQYVKDKRKLCRACVARFEFQYTKWKEILGDRLKPMKIKLRRAL